MAPYMPLLLFLTLPFPTSSPLMARSGPRALPAWDAPRPREQWNVQGSIGKHGSEWRIGLWKSPFSAFSFTLDPGSVRLVVKNHRGVAVPVQVSSAEPAAQVPTPRAQFPGEQSFRVKWNVASLKPDMYTISATLRVQTTDDATGQPVALPTVNVSAIRYYKTPEPDTMPSLKPGQRFLFIPRYEPTPDDLKHVAEDTARRKAARKISDERLFAINAVIALGLAVPDALVSSKPDTIRPPRFQPRYQMPYVDAQTGAPVKMRDVVLKVFTLKAEHRGKDGVSVLDFAVEGRMGNERLASDSDVLHLPHLTPLFEDSTVRRLRAKYEGKRVWFNGGGGFECVTLVPHESGSFGTDSKTPYRIKRLVRLYRPDQTLAIGAAPGLIGAREESEFIFDNPIIAIVRVPANAPLGGFEWGGFAMTDPPKDMPGRAGDLRTICADTFITFADAWDMERECRLEDPQTVARKWPAQFRAAVAKGELRTGMTPDMVVAAIGWPNEFATPDEMRKWDAWRYDSTPPYNYWVNFRNGRVTSWGPDGQLP